jgi:hypothetical protein
MLALSSTSTDDQSTPMFLSAEDVAATNSRTARVAEPHGDGLSLSREIHVARREQRIAWAYGKWGAMSFFYDTVGLL